MLRIAFGALQLVEPQQRDARGHTREPFTHQRRIHEHPIVAYDVSEVPFVSIARRTVLFEMDPPVQNQFSEPIARLARKRCGGIEAPANLRRVDAEQPDASHPGHGNGVAVEDCGDEE